MLIGWNKSGDHLNIKMSSYQYRDSHVKDKMVSPTVLPLTWESPYLGKMVFILRQVPGCPVSQYSPRQTADRSSNILALDQYIKGDSPVIWSWHWDLFSAWPPHQIISVGYHKHGYKNSPQRYFIPLKMRVESDSYNIMLIWKKIRKYHPISLLGLYWVKMNLSIYMQVQIKKYTICRKTKPFPMIKGLRSLGVRYGIPIWFLMQNQDHVYD